LFLPYEMMAHQSGRRPLLTIEREAHAFGVLMVQDFQSPLLLPMRTRSMFLQVRFTNRCSRHPPQSCHINFDIAGCIDSTETSYVCRQGIEHDSAIRHTYEATT
jgi:hypothetical protein